MRRSGNEALVADYEEWTQFFEMKISYTKEGKKLEKKNDTQSILDFANEELSNAGFQNPVIRK